MVVWIALVQKTEAVAIAREHDAPFDRRPGHHRRVILGIQSRLGGGQNTVSRSPEARDKLLRLRIFVDQEAEAQTAASRLFAGATATPACAIRRRSSSASISSSARFSSQ